MITRVYVADNFIKRLLGLLGRKKLQSNEALLISKCNSIHTFFMKYTIDALFLDIDFNVVGIERNIQPGRISKIYKRAFYTLEILPEADQFNINQNMEWLQHHVGERINK